ncbi:hypothetical protein CTZ27_16325 [Streptomyces griseocarneus]|nr:hypothetical protein CTZ27_16325 [Streptomyces griseocarneus]
MGLFDKLMGTRRPGRGIAPRSAAEVRAALLALNETGVQWVVRNPTSGESGDLVAEWRILEPASKTLLVRTQMSRTLKTSMRLVPGDREVRALDEQWDVEWIGDSRTLARSREYTRGPVTTFSRQWTYEKGPDGRRRKVETFHFNSRQMKDSLRDAVLGAGWTWRGVMRKL